MESDPYVITTKRETGDDPYEHEPLVSRRAVATLEEARDLVWESARSSTFDPHDWNKPINEIPDTGGTVGPLPGGTVIEVESVTWEAIAGVSALSNDLPGRPRTPAEMLDAYNARQENG